MRKFLLLLVALPFTAFAQSWYAPGLIANNQIGSSGMGRNDAQIEFRNDGAIGHALISGMQMAYPGVIDREVSYNAQAFTSIGANQQLGSVSWIWHVADDATFNSVFRLEVSQGQVPIRCWGRNLGCVFLAQNGAAADHNPATGPLLRIDRWSGYPSLAGKSDLYLLGKDGGSGPIGLNVDVNGSGNGGPVQIGGPLQFFAGSQVGGCPGTVPSGAQQCIQITAPNGANLYIPAF